MAKRVKHEEHENHERWLVSYADFITLLFAFFVVMYSVSRVDNKKLVQTSDSIRWALHFEGTGGVNSMPIFEGPPSEGGCAVNLGTKPRAPPSNEQQAVQALRRKIEKRLHHFLLDRGASNTVQIFAEGKRLSVRLAAKSFFDPAFAALRPDSLPVLDAVAAELALLGQPVRVEGHTDDSPVGVAGSRFRNNWELSAARAAVVVDYIEHAHHMPAELLSAAGLASTHPLKPNETADGREANRRVEMVVELPAGDALSVAAR